MTTTAPLSWIKKIQASLFTLDQKPQFGGIESFPWHTLEQGFRHLFSDPSLTVHYETLGWIESQHIRQGLGEKLFEQPLFLSPLETPVYFLMSEQDVSSCLKTLLKDVENASTFMQIDSLSAFFKFLLLEALGKFPRIPFAEDLSPRLGESTADLAQNLDQKPSFALNIFLNVSNQTIHGRLIVPEAFRGEWKQYQAKKRLTSLKKEALREIPVEVCCEVGKTSLKWKQFETLKTGDLIVLDTCSFDPERNKGRLILTFLGDPIFRGKMGQEGMQLLAYPLYEEGEAPVNNEDDEDEDFEEENLYGDMDDEEDEDEDDLDFDELLKKSKESSARKQEEIKEKEDDEEEEKPFEKEAKISFEPKKIPIHITVEMGRVKMTAEELLNLSPGNLLEISRHPEQGVDLVVNGKKIGRGELVKMGEILGVRVLEL